MANNAKKRGINIKDIYTGEVVLIKEYGIDEKISLSQNVIKTNDDTKITSLSIRKIVFTLKGDIGTDLSRGLCKKNKYSYKVVDTTNVNDEDKNIKNNTLVIDNAEKVGSVLFLAGFPIIVKEKELKKITKLLLSRDKVLNIREHSLKLDGDNIFDLNQVKQANEQAKTLYLFKSSKLPTKPQEIEKVYKKHFK